MAQKKTIRATTGEPTILIVDDHPVARAGVAAIIGAANCGRVVGHADGAKVAMEMIERLRPHLVILDLSLGDKPGLEVIKDLRAAQTDTAILVLSMHDEQIYAERAIRAGARGYVMKSQAANDIIYAIAEVLAGRVYVSHAVSSRLLSHLAGRPKAGSKLSLDRLTDRELEIFELLGQGRSVKQIARLLHLSGKTVEAHREHIKEKLDMGSSSELLRLAILSSAAGHV